MASDVIWRNGVAGNWFDAGNWASGTVPVTGDSAIIHSGTAIISSTTDPLIVGQRIFLGGADGSPVILEAINATFEGTSSSTTPEINTTLTVNGSHSDVTDAHFIIE